MKMNRQLTEERKILKKKFGIFGATRQKLKVNNYRGKIIERKKTGRKMKTVQPRERVEC